MTVAFDNAKGTATFASSASFVLTTTTTVKALIVSTFLQSGSNAVSAIAYAGVALTRMGIAAGAPRTEMWFLTAPAAGANTLSCQFSTASNWGLIAASYTGSKDSNPVGGCSSFTTGFASSVNFSASASTDSLVVIGFCASSAITPGNATARASLGPTGGNMLFCDIAGKSGATTASCSASFASWSVLSLSLKESAGGVVLAVPSMSLLGAGF